ncbi:hypothetical protein ACU8YE_05825 [Ralstonia sp. VS2407]
MLDIDRVLMMVREIAAFLTHLVLGVVFNFAAGAAAWVIWPKVVGDFPSPLSGKGLTICLLALFAIYQIWEFAGFVSDRLYRIPRKERDPNDWPRAY